MTSYTAVHRALRRRRGPARGRPCVICGRASAVWACYPCDDADVITGVNTSGRPVTYVPSLDGYQPMCWRHANAYDRARADRRRALKHLAVAPLPANAAHHRLLHAEPEAATLFKIIDGQMQ